jgi:hypothetical protein
METEKDVRQIADKQANLNAIHKFNSIMQEIGKQNNFIENKFGIKPRYVLLGVNTEKALLAGARVQSHLYFWTGEYSTKTILFQHAGLIPIVDYTLPLKLPEDFVQVVIPLEVVGL